MNVSIFGADGLLQERLRAIPGVLRETLEVAGHWGPLPRCEHWDVVGVGGSEGPARLLVELLSDRGVLARQCTVSSFLKGRCPGANSRGLVVFSQGLSPHARMVLKGAASYAHCIVITTRSELEVRQQVPAYFHHQLTVLEHPPQAEPDSLLRVVGPAAAALLAVRVAVELSGGSAMELAQIRTDLQEAMAWYEGTPSDIQALEDSEWFARVACAHPTFCLAAAQDLPAANQLMWKWQEATYQPLPPTLDLLAFIHGPFQSIYDESVTVLALRSQSDMLTDRAWEALQQVLVPARHQLLVLDAPVAFPLSYFYFDAAFLRVLARAVVERKLRLDRWPGKGKDGALYELVLPETRPAR
jgi:hypothetical protein